MDIPRIFNITESAHRNYRGFWRTRLPRFLVVGKQGALRAGGRRHSFALSMNRAFARFDSGAIATDVPDQFVPKVTAVRLKSE